MYSHVSLSQFCIEYFNCYHNILRKTTIVDKTANVQRSLCIRLYNGDAPKSVTLCFMFIISSGPFRDPLKLIVQL